MDGSDLDAFLHASNLLHDKFLKVFFSNFLRIEQEVKSMQKRHSEQDDHAFAKSLLECDAFYTLMTEGVGFTSDMDMPDLDHCIFKTDQKTFNFTSQSPAELRASYNDRLADVIAEAKVAAIEEKKQSIIDARIKESLSANLEMKKKLELTEQAEKRLSNMTEKMDLDRLKSLEPLKRTAKNSRTSFVLLEAEDKEKQRAVVQARRESVQLTSEEEEKVRMTSALKFPPPLEPVHVHTQMSHQRTSALHPGGPRPAYVGPESESDSTSPPPAKPVHAELKELAESITEQVVAIRSKAGLDLPVVDWRMIKNAQETLEHLVSHPGLYDGSFLDILKEKPK